MCRKLCVTRGGYYAWRKRQRSQRQLNDEVLLKRIKVAHEASRETYGYPRVHAQLKREGEHCGRHRVARLMRANGIKAKGARRFKRHAHRDYLYHDTPNLLLARDKPTAANQVWVGDVTYIRVGAAWQYLSTVMDLHTRKVIGWHFSAERNTRLACEALMMALEDYTPTTETIFHSDQGIEFVNKAYRRLLQENGIQASLSRRGHCWDNAAMESFFHTLKIEMVYFQRFQTIVDAIAYIMNYIHYYNNERLHSSLCYQTPNEFERAA